MNLTVLGMVIGALICAVWRVRFSNIESLYKLRTLLKALEHYHHGLLLIIISSFVASPSLSSFLFGLGSYLIIDEANQDTPFAYGKDTFKASTSIGVILVVIWIVCLFIV